MPEVSVSEKSVPEISVPEIGLLDTRIAQKFIVPALQHDTAGLQHVAPAAGFQRIGGALLDQQDGNAASAVNLRDALENLVDDGRRQAHRRLVEHQQPWQRGQAPEFLRGLASS